ncbi:hypothetical protein GCM10010389_54180 [Streptomyces echinoruber]|uniref:Uncharacterized protein n=1 Tax=Streptomyces echinoruber TaxID=68898 RepID=A0A918VMN3_9ACTN|nr:hypothetical protein [Streptomyces echinoruber]GHA08227.1 hypothetical protein GCM10010389_54180 [Streptomyces echinoruber]
MPPPPPPPHASEATRLLCVGTYLDPSFRERVLEELHLNEQRLVAPSLGFDAARVLAHALRARRIEAGWAAGIVGLWIVGLLITDRLLAGYLVPSLLLAMGGATHGSEENPPLSRRVTAFFFRWLGRLMLLVFLVATVTAAFHDDSSGDGSSGYGTSGESSGATQLLLMLPLALTRMIGGDGTVTPLQAWLALLMFVAVALCAGAQRSRLVRSLGAELSPRRFPDAASDPAERAEGERFRRLRARIRLEQRSPLIMYRETRPFCGAGSAHDTWVLAVEMRPKRDEKPRPMSNRTVLDTIRPLLEGLRLPPEYAGHAVRDRLRWLEIDECVFLPAEGLARREEAPYGEEAFETHRSRAVEEGAEKRRHFLRVRVGGWEEELVVTVYVRVHTQGRMLMLEIAPHVLMPIRSDFKEADRTAHQFRGNSLLGKAAWAVGQVPAASVRSVVALAQVVAYGWRLLTGGYDSAPVDGPAVSVRELGAAPSGSLFQRMDVDRYLRSVQDRIAHGVRTALSEHGYQTDEFVQKVVNISNGGVHIESVEGSTFAVGSHAHAASTTNGGPAPQKGSDSDEHGG